MTRAEDIFAEAWAATDRLTGGDMFVIEAGGGRAVVRQYAELEWASAESDVMRMGALYWLARVAPRQEVEARLATIPLAGELFGDAAYVREILGDAEAADELLARVGRTAVGDGPHATAALRAGNLERAIALLAPVTAITERQIGPYILAARASRGTPWAETGIRFALLARGAAREQSVRVRVARLLAELGLAEEAEALVDEIDHDDRGRRRRELDDRRADPLYIQLAEVLLQIGRFDAARAMVADICLHRRHAHRAAAQSALAALAMATFGERPEAERLATLVETEAIPAATDAEAADLARGYLVSTWIRIDRVKSLGIAHALARAIVSRPARRDALLELGAYANRLDTGHAPLADDAPAPPAIAALVERDPTPDAHDLFWCPELLPVRPPRRR